MGIYEPLTKYLHTQTPDEIYRFTNDMYTFIDSHPEYKLNQYKDILEANGIHWDKESMQKADITALNERCVLALILGVVRAERFCEGTLLYFFENGIIEKWLLHLKSIDTNKESLD